MTQSTKNLLSHFMPTEVINHIIGFACPFTTEELIHKKLRLKRITLFFSYKQFSYKQYYNLLYDFEGIRDMDKKRGFFIGNNKFFIKHFMSENGMRVYKTNDKRNLNNCRKLLYPNFFSF